MASFVSDETYGVIMALGAGLPWRSGDGAALHEAAIALAPNLVTIARFERTDPRVQTRIGELVGEANHYLEGVRLGEDVLTLGLSGEAHEITPTEVSDIVRSAVLIAQTLGHASFELTCSGAWFEGSGDGHDAPELIQSLGAYLGS